LRHLSPLRRPVIVLTTGHHVNKDRAPRLFVTLSVPDFRGQESFYGLLRTPGLPTLDHHKWSPAATIHCRELDSGWQTWASDEPEASSPSHVLALLTDGVSGEEQFAPGLAGAPFVLYHVVARGLTDDEFRGRVQIPKSFDDAIRTRDGHVELSARSVQLSDEALHLLLSQEGARSVAWWGTMLNVVGELGSSCERGELRGLPFIVAVGIRNTRGTEPTVTASPKELLNVLARNTHRLGP